MIEAVRVESKRRLIFENFEIFVSSRRLRKYSTIFENRFLTVFGKIWKTGISGFTVSVLRIFSVLPFLTNISRSYTGLSNIFMIFRSNISISKFSIF